MKSEKLSFMGSQGHRLMARLDVPASGDIRTSALFAHCFTCSKNLKAATNIARAMNGAGIAVLRFDFTGLGQLGDRPRGRARDRRDGVAVLGGEHEVVTTPVPRDPRLHDRLDVRDVLFDHRGGGQRLDRVALDAVAYSASTTLLTQFEQLDRRGADVQPEQRHLLLGKQAHVRSIQLPLVCFPGRRAAAGSWFV